MCLSKPENMPTQKHLRDTTAVFVTVCSEMKYKSSSLEKKLKKLFQLKICYLNIV